jgi:hypothetical protein
MKLFNINLVEGVNIPSWLLSSLLAGYIMYLVDLALEGWFGLFGSYKLFKSWLIEAGIFSGIEDIALFIGHEVNSVFLSLFFVNPVFYKRLPENLFLKGISFGILWHLAVILVCVIFGISGSIWLYQLLTMPVKEHISLFLLHIVWGLSLSYLYRPNTVKTLEG